MESPFLMIRAVLDGPAASIQAFPQQPQELVVVVCHSVHELPNWSKQTRKLSSLCFQAGPGQGPHGSQLSPQRWPVPQKGSSQSE
jgi:hypothetical protein